MSEPDFAKLRFLGVDVDGVMTDGGMYYTESGDQFKKFHAKDGVGIKVLLDKGIEVGVISAGSNAKLIHNRAATLGIRRVYAGTESKLRILRRWCDELDIGLEQVAYIGDDLPDLEIMQAVGIAACPADAVAAIKEISHIVLERKGGDACVRELIDTYIAPALE